MLLKTVEHVQNLLKQNEKFIDKDGNIFTQNILEAIEKIDRDLVKLLLSDEKIREQFFIKIDDVFVLEQNKLIEFFTMNEYFNNSFTSYTNKIGLIKKDSFIKKFDDVVLAWPHKDCVLEGGQSKDDEKNNEVFYNEILSRDEIDRLFEPKALTNIKRYTKDGVEENSQINEDDNLIIKGNNLIALHSLKKKYARKVKLIYIDPPYNTGNDSFKYNDRFNHSTWLTFMKNRLEVAREFLSDDGVIFVSIDDNEQAYLKVLMDDIFSRDKFVNTITWKRKGGKTSPDTKKLENSVDFIHIYKKHELFKINFLFTKENSEDYIKKQFKYKDEDGRKYRISPLNAPQPRPTLQYEFMGYKPHPNGWSVKLETLQKFYDDNKLVFPKNSEGRVNRKQYLDEWDGYAVNSLWDDIGLIAASSSERVNFDRGQKPEKLIKRVIELSTKQNDIILDFHLGSGTTCAVSHKMNRQYIGIEQMEYIEDLPVGRLKNVLSGENGGISKALKWQGGGEFIYLELDKYNQKIIDDLSQATEKNILDIYNEICEKGFLNYDIELSKIKEHFEEFKALTLEQQKEFLISILNKNQLYKNLSEIDDKDLQVSDKIKELNKSFYNISDKE